MSIMSEGYVIEDVFRSKRTRKGYSRSDIMIYCKLEDVSIDPVGNLVLFLSKENKSYLSFLLRLLQGHRGKGCSISIRIKEHERNNEYGR